MAPRRQSRPQPSCTEQSPLHFSPTPKSVEILECTWPDQPAAHLTIERYPSAQLAQQGISDHWAVGDTSYGKTMFTSDNSGANAERWWAYTGSPLVFELSGTKAAVDSLSNQLIFRTPNEAQTGQGAPK